MVSLLQDPQNLCCAPDFALPDPGSPIDDFTDDAGYICAVVNDPGLIRDPHQL
jgi:hypothetical protein